MNKKTITHLFEAHYNRVLKGVKEDIPIESFLNKYIRYKDVPMEIVHKELIKQIKQDSHE